ncbi:MAG: glycogen synthase [Deltaproteobacteria bacterium]|nr:glycogen synthase [Deltaproteobacteria bacterium]
MNVLFVSSEVAPFAKTGGLGDVAAALPKALMEAGAHAGGAGHDVRVVMPLYARVQQSPAGRQAELSTVIREVQLTLGGTRVVFSVLEGMLPGTKVPVYFVRCPGLYGRAGIYTQDHDEHLRFAVLSWAALMICQRLRFEPDVVHANDWQTSLLPLLLRTMFAWDRLFARTRTVLTIHNIGHQGTFGAGVLGDTGLADAWHHLHQDQLRGGSVNFLLTGILYANAITTVSPTYAREIQTPEHGVGLDGFLRERASVLFGVLNGIDEAEWSPERDEKLPHRYSLEDLTGKELCKKALLESAGLPYVREVPVIGIVSRLAWQKGFDLCFHVLPRLLSRRAVQLVVLGTGEPKYEGLFEALSRRFPKQVAYLRAFSEPAAHLIEAGADMFLIPSRYEPCGLNQLYSLRYGTPPIVHRTGGLADTVHAFEATRGSGNGFVFEHFDEGGLSWALSRALSVWGSGEGADRATWQRLQANGMRGRYGWGDRVTAYEQVYRLVAPGR